MRKFIIFFSSIAILFTSGYANIWQEQGIVNGGSGIVFCNASDAHPDDPDGGFLLVGFKISDYNVYLRRVSASGELLWDKHVTSISGAKCAAYTDDYGFLIGSNSSAIYRVDKNGNAYNNSYYVNGLLQLSVSFVRAIRRTEGGYHALSLMTQELYFINESGSNTYKIFDTQYGYSEDFAYKNNKFYFIAVSGNGLGNVGRGILCTDANGNPLSSFGNNGELLLNQGTIIQDVETYGTDIIITGMNEYFFMFIAKYDGTTGANKYYYSINRQISPRNENVYFNHISLKPANENGHTMVAGGLEYKSPTERDFFALYFNARTGNHVASYNMPNPGLDCDYWSCAFGATVRGDVIIGGYHEDNHGSIAGFSIDEIYYTKNNHYFSWNGLEEKEGSGTYPYTENFTSCASSKYLISESGKVLEYYSHMYGAGYTHIAGITAKDIAYISPGLGLYAAGSNGQLYLRDRSGWSNQGGSYLKRIDIDKNETIWAVKDWGSIEYKPKNQSWWSSAWGVSNVSDIAAGNGKVWVVANGGNVYEQTTPNVWSNRNFSLTASRIDIDNNGYAWVVDTEGSLWQYNGSGWTRHKYRDNIKDVSFDLAN